MSHPVQKLDLTRSGSLSVVFTCWNVLKSRALNQRLRYDKKGVLRNHFPRILSQLLGIKKAAFLPAGDLRHTQSLESQLEYVVLLRFLNGGVLRNLNM